MNWSYTIVDASFYMSRSASDSGSRRLSQPRQTKALNIQHRLHVLMRSIISDDELSGGRAAVKWNETI